MACFITQRLHSSFLGFPDRILNTKHKKERLWSLWVATLVYLEGSQCIQRDEKFEPQNAESTVQLLDQTRQECVVHPAVMVRRHGCAIVSGCR